MSIGLWFLLLDKAEKVADMAAALVDKGLPSQLLRPMEELDDAILEVKSQIK